MTDSSTATLTTISEQLKNEFLRFIQSSKAKPAQSFVVLKEFIDANLISVPQCKKIQKFINHNGFTIFQTKKPNVNDRKRVQFNLHYPKQCGHKLFKREVQIIREKVTKLFRLAATTRNFKIKLSMLLSLPGCQKQQFHCDNDTSSPEALTAAVNSFIVILGVEDGTSLLYLDENNVEQSICILPGELFIARGAFVHAGASYADFNFRFHFYIDWFNNKRESDFTNFNTRGYYYDYYRVRSEHAKKVLNDRLEKKRKTNEQLENARKIKSQK